MPFETAPAAAPANSEQQPQQGQGNVPASGGENSGMSAKDVVKQFEGGSKQPAQAQSKPQESASDLFEVKVNGKIQKMTRQEVIDHASMAYAANERFSEARKMREEAERFKNTAQKSPLEALLDPALGLSKEQIRTAMEDWYNREFIEPETLTQEQREFKRIQEENKRYKEQEEQNKKKEEESARAAEIKAHSENFQREIIETLEKSGLPKTKYNAQRMAFYMRQNLMNGYKAPMEVIVRQVKNEQQSTFRDQIAGSDAKQIIDMLGDEIVNKIRKYDLQQLRERKNGGAQPFSATKDLSAPTDKIDYDEVNRRLRKLRT